MTTNSTLAPSAHTPTRRELLMAAPVAAVALAVPVAALAATPAADAKIVAAWAEWQAARRALDEMDDDLLGCETEEENALWDRVNAAEATIHRTTATTPQGLSYKLWLNLDHSVTKRDHDAAVRSCNLPALVGMMRDLDWREQLIVSALQSLSAMEGR